MGAWWWFTLGIGGSYVRVRRFCFVGINTLAVDYDNTVKALISYADPDG